MQKTSLSFAILTSFLVIAFLMHPLAQVEIVQANPIPYQPTNELPTLTVQTPEPSSPIYASNNLELKFNVTTPQSWISYYRGQPNVATVIVLCFLDGVRKQAYPFANDTFNQYTVDFTNLTNNSTPSGLTYTATFFTRAPM